MQFLEIKLFTFDYHENKSQRTVDFVPMFYLFYIGRRSSPLMLGFQNMQSIIYKMIAKLTQKSEVSCVRMSSIFSFFDTLLSNAVTFKYFF